MSFSQTSSSSSSRSHSRPTGPAPHVGGLRMFDEPDESRSLPPPQRELPADSTRFRAVAMIINLGLCMLETPVGTDKLVAIGQRVISLQRNFDNIYEDRPENMSWWVGLFLARLRASFPTIVLTNHNMGGEGKARKADWARDGSRMRQWDPSKAGTLFLNKMIIKNMCQAGLAHVQSPSEHNLVAFETFIFLMGVTVAHEMLHFFIGFLVGYVTPHTPALVSFLPRLHNNIQSDGTEVGESGRAWEGLVFGGIVEAYESVSSPLGAQQAGLLFLIDASEIVRPVSHNCIRRCLAFDFEFPLQLIGQPRRLAQIERERRSMAEVRRGQLPANLRTQAPHISPTISMSEVRRLRASPSFTYQGRQFSNLLLIPRQPAYLFAVA